MKKLLAILVAVLMLASVLTAVTATAAAIEFTVAAKMAGDQVQVDLNVKGAGGKGACVFGPFVITFDDTKLSIPYTPASGLNNIDDTNFVVGNGTAAGGYEAIIVSDDLKSVKILYADAKGKVIAGDGTVLSLLFNVKAGAEGTVSFALSATDAAIVSSEEEELEFTAAGSASVDLVKATEKVTEKETEKVTEKETEKETIKETEKTTKGKEDPHDTGVATPIALLVLAAAAGVVLVKTKKS